MKNLIFILSIIIYLSFQISSCKIKKETVKNIEKIEFDFEILTDEISLEELNEIDDFRKKLNTYSDYQIIATLKQINKSIENLEVNNFIINENFEIIDLKKESKNELISQYDFTPIFDPESFETDGIGGIILKPNEHSIYSMNLVREFRFYLSKPDTFLIRIKKQYFEKEIYSNWDTLIIN